MCGSPLLTILVLRFLFPFLLAIWAASIKSSDEWGSIVVDHKKIRDRYLRSTFYLDLVSAVPVEWSAYFFGYKTDDRIVGILALVRVLRMHRLAMSGRVKTQGLVLRFSRLFFALVMVAHWFGAMFFGLGSAQVGKFAFSYTFPFPLSLLCCVLHCCRLRPDSCLCGWLVLSCRVLCRSLNLTGGQVNDGLLRKTSSKPTSSHNSPIPFISPL